MNKLTQEDINNKLSVIISNLKHHDTAEKRIVCDKNIKRDLFFNVILSLSEEDNFLFMEKDKETGREGIFIKGYVRDVWEFLEEAYDLIHNQKFEEQ